MLYAHLDTYPITGVEINGSVITIYLYGEPQADREILEQFRRTVALLYPNVQLLTIAPYEEKDWEAQWRKQLAPIAISDDIVVLPLGTHAHPSAALQLYITPKYAFGTGEHATTQMMLQLLSEAAKPNQFWIDAGTGTGILAIALAKLGCRHVLAIDNDPIAIEEARENAQKNSVAKNITFLHQDVTTLTLPQTDGIAANLFFTLHETLFPQYARALNCGGQLICSGIFEDDFDKFQIFLSEHHFAINKVLQASKWVAVWSTKQ